MCCKYQYFTTTLLTFHVLGNICTGILRLVGFLVVCFTSLIKSYYIVSGRMPLKEDRMPAERHQYVPVLLLDFYKLIRCVREYRERRGVTQLFFSHYSRFVCSVLHVCVHMVSYV